MPWPGANGLLLGTTALLVAVMALALVSGTEATRLPIPSRSAAPQPTSVPELERPEFPSATPPLPAAAGESSGSGTVLVVFGVLLLLTIIAVTLWYLRGRRLRLARRAKDRGLRIEPEAATADAAEPEVAAAVEAGIGELEDESADPRRAVIACWLRLESAAATAGVERRPDDAPADLVTRLLRSYAIDEAVLLGFADLYRRARYAPADVDDRMRRQARETLGRLHEAIAEARTRPVTA